MNGSGRRPTQPFPILPRMCQAGPGPFPENLPFELSKDGHQTRHRSTRRSVQVQCLGQGHEADTQVRQLDCLPRPVVLPNNIQLAAR